MVKDKPEQIENSFSILIDNINWTSQSEINQTETPIDDPTFVCQASVARLSNRLTSCGTSEWIK